MEILGLPLHPLVVHAVVVLVPLSALGGIAIALLGKARKRYGSLVTVITFGAMVSTIVAQQAGKALYAKFSQHTAQLETHASLGGGLLIWVILLFAGVVVVMVGQRMIDRDVPRGRIAYLAGAAITVVTGVISIVQVLRIGHSGATAVWAGI